MPKRVEKENRKQSKLDENLRFFDKINVEFLVHELKDPVAVIETTLHALMDHKDIYGSLSKRQEATLKRTLLSSKKIREMLYNLLEVGRGQAASFTFRKCKVEETVIETLIDTLEVWDYPIFEKLEEIPFKADQLSYLETCGIYFKSEPNIENLEVILDDIKFRQIVTNLIKNALNHRFNYMEVALSQKDLILVVAVKDDGQGIEPEHHHLIFEQYTQLNEISPKLRSGHGLGLAGAQILARCLGGNIKIQSEKGKGAVFLLSLPIAARRLDTDK